MAGEPRDPARAIVPAQARQSNTAWISSHDERRVGGSGHGRKSGSDRRKRSFLAQPRKRREITSGDGGSEHIRPDSIGDDQYYLRTITWRASCRGTQL